MVSMTMSPRWTLLVVLLSCLGLEDFTAQILDPLWERILMMLIVPFVVIVSGSRRF